MLHKWNLAAYLILAIGANGDVPKADYFYLRSPVTSPSMWVFGSNSVSMYREDGTLIKESKVTLDDGLGLEFVGDVVSDGSDYVYAISTGRLTAPTHVEVFDLPTGTHVASLPTCGDTAANDLAYHPLRREVWVQCRGTPDGRIDIIKADDLFDEPQPVATDVVDAAWVLDDPSLPVGTVYAGSPKTSSLYVMSLDPALVLRKQISLPENGIVGIRDVKYSSLNKHLFIRGYVCCSCGFEGADLGAENCPGDNLTVDVTTGPNQATGVPGTCGPACESSPADTLGVLEFDTVSETVVAEFADTAGTAADIYTDPTGRFVVIIANDGVGDATIIKTGVNGEPSETFAIAETGFSNFEAGKKGRSDVCFVQTDLYDVALFTSNLANYVVVADLSNFVVNKVMTKKLWLFEEDAIQSSDTKRNCAWAFDTPYVWVNARETGDVHLIKLNADGDVSKAKLSRQFAYKNTISIRWIYNHRAEALAKSIVSELRKELADGSSNYGNHKKEMIEIDRLVTDVESLEDNMRDFRQRVNALAGDVSNGKVSLRMAQDNIIGLANNMAKFEIVEEQDKGTDWYALAGPAGFVMGALAVVLSSVNLIVMCCCGKQKKQTQAVKLEVSGKDAEMS